jgi:hypothetical protein
MQTLPVSNIVEAIKHLSLSDLERVKNTIIAQEMYFKKFQKDELEDIIQDFVREGYSREFISDLEEGLKKCSVFNED